jgi:hypothetical protein
LLPIRTWFQLFVDGISFRSNCHNKPGSEEPFSLFLTPSITVVPR